jgi:hypothetical protein
VSFSSKTSLVGGTAAHSSRSFVSRDATDDEPKRLEVNLVFTDAQTTARALGAVESLARDLGACIRLRAPVVVPRQLPLDESPVSVRFVEGCLADLASRLAHDGFESTAHVYLCRDQAEALLQVLSANSLLVVGGKNRWWPTTRLGRLVKVLRSNGHRVVFIRSNGCQSDGQ